jgi:hypothetical protein
MNYAEFMNDWNYSTQAIDKAAKNAASTVAFDMKKQLTSDLKAGNIAGQKMKPMREISKSPALKQRYYAKGGGEFSRIPNSKPLWILHKVVRYNVAEQSDTLFHYEVGFVSTPKAPISRNWMEIAQRQQAGASYPVSEALKKKLAEVGASLGRKNWRRKLYFIKAKDFTDPPRDIIDSFYAAHGQAAIGLIRERFNQMMTGAWTKRRAGTTDTSWMKVNS